MVKPRRAKLRKVLPIALGLAVGGSGTAYADTNTFEINDSFFNRTADGILVADYKHDINRKTKTSIDSLLKGGNVTDVYAIDAVTGINNVIKSLNTNPRARQYFSEEQRQNLIGRYQSFLYEISREKRSLNYKKSLENLSNAVKDRVIEPDELNDVEKGFYMIIKKGIRENKESYGVFALVRLEEKTAEILQIETKKEDYSKLPDKIPAKDEKKEIPELSLETPGQKEKLDEPKVPQENYKPSKLELYVDALGGPGLLGLTIDADGNPVLTNNLPVPGGIVGGRIGLIGYSENGNGFGGGVEVIYGFPETLLSTQSSPTSTGRYFVGSKVNGGSLGLGANLEAQFGKDDVKFLLGADGKVWIYNQKGISGWYKDGNPVPSLNPNDPNPTTGAEIHYDFSGGAYSGVKAGWFRIIGGWDSRRGVYGGLGGSIPLVTKDIQN